jgi:hypothetical protein
MFNVGCTQPPEYIKVLNSPAQHSVEFEALKGLLRRVAEEVEAEIRQVEKELAEARRVGVKRRAEELSAIRDILYEDKWFRIATAVYAHLKKLFAEDGKAGGLLEAAERRLFGLRLEVVEVPLLKIEAAVDQEGEVAAVRCRAALDVGVEAVLRAWRRATDLKRRQALAQRPRRRQQQTQKRRWMSVEAVGAEAKKEAGWSACWRR